MFGSSTVYEKWQNTGFRRSTKKFYLSFWDLLKEDFVEMANYCFSVELMPESMRQALIALLF
jgi:hypothetical protein